MLSAGWLILAVLVAILLTSWVTFTVTRLDRLHAKVDAAQAALDAQLVRRAAALLHVADSSASRLSPPHIVQLSQAALSALSALSGSAVSGSALSGSAASESTPSRSAPSHARPPSNAPASKPPPPNLPVSLSNTSAERAATENQVGRAIGSLAPWRESLAPESVAELSEAATRVAIARSFFNDTVRDTRALRARRMPRVLHLAGHRELPQFFDIDDTNLLEWSSGHNGFSDPISETPRVEESSA
jgi:hypothetical protein